LKAEVDPTPAEIPRLKPDENSLFEPLGLKAELPRMNAGAPTIALWLRFDGTPGQAG
jgi:hypothetical protein